MSSVAHHASRTLIRRRAPRSLLMDVTANFAPTNTNTAWIHTEATMLASSQETANGSSSVLTRSLTDVCYNKRSFSSFEARRRGKKGTLSKFSSGSSSSKKTKTSKSRKSQAAKEAARAAYERKQQFKATTTSKEHPLTKGSSNAASTTAASLMENWEESATGSGAFSRLRNSRSNNFPPSSPSMHQDDLPFKQLRFFKFRRAFSEAVSDYGNLWYQSPYISKGGNAKRFKESLKFQHPPVWVASWDKVIQSEEAFKTLCNVHHDLFLASASLPKEQHAAVEFENEDLESSVPSSYEVQNVLLSLLPFWERIRKERKEIVDHLRPQENYNSDHVSTSVVQDGGWMNWLVSTIRPQKSQQDDVKVTAHEDASFGPNAYHYSKLIMHLYYYPLLEESEKDTREEFYDGSVEEAGATTDSELNQAMLQKRADMIQAVVDQCSSPDNLNSKVIRLLVRAHADVGSLKAAQQAERVYHSFRNNHKNLLWRVLSGYLKVIEVHAQIAEKNIATGPIDEIGGAAKVALRRICKLVSAKHSSEPSEFVSCSVLAFQALSLIAPYSEDVSGFDDRLHSLGILKFGPKAWEALMQPKPRSGDMSTLHRALHPKDHKIISQLILIYGANEKGLDRALQILDNAFDCFSPDELKTSFTHGVFHALLQTLIKKQKSRILKETSEEAQSGKAKLCRSNPELEVGFALTDRMMSEDDWFPNHQTFFHLFRLASHSGYDADCVRMRLEACRSLSAESPCNQKTDGIRSPAYPLNPVKAAKFTLNGWIATAEKNGGETPNGEVDPANRAWEILSSLRAASSPLFLPAETVSGIYDLGSAPDVSTYILVLKICGRVRSKASKEVTMKVLDIVEKEGLIMEGSICLALLRAINNSLDMDHRVAMTKRVYLLAMAEENGPIKLSIRKGFEGQIGYFRRQHPKIYEEHLSMLFNDDDEMVHFQASAS